MKLIDISNHIKEQNWFAVLLDLLVVIVGVVIAVQIGNWNQTQQQKQIYNEAIDRVIVELKTNITSMEDKRKQIGIWLPIVQLALEDLRACKTDEKARARIETAFAPADVNIKFYLDVKALDQLINNDSFLIFQTRETRKQLMSLSTFVQYIGVASKDMLKNRQSYKDISHIIQPGPLTVESPEQVLEAIRMGELPSSQMVRKTKLTVPLSTTCKDSALLSYFYLWEDSAYYHWVMGGLALEKLKTYLETLSRLAT